MVFCVAVAAVPSLAYAGEDLLTLLRTMPADFPMAIVVPDFEKTDKVVTALQNRLKPDSTDPGMLADLKSELKFGEWIDFSKPVGMAKPNVGGDEWMVIWARIPDFADKVKTVANAQEKEGVWELPFEEGHSFFASVRGEYVVASDSSEFLATATKPGRSLADELKSRMDLLEKRDVLVHISMEPLRETVLGGVAQFAQMAPMMAMMAGQQSGDPATMTALFGAISDAAERLVEQLAALDLAIGVADEAIDVTVATTYTDGAIKSYLAKQKPAGVPLLADIEEQPYVAAMGYHVPGETAPFFDYLIDSMKSAMKKAQPEAGAAPASEGQTDDLDNAMRVARDFYRAYEGMNMVVALSPGNMRMSGDYVTRDPKTLIELLKKSLLSSNPLMQQFNSGATYEALGTENIGDVPVEQFALKFDTTNPSGATAAQLYGESARFGAGVVRDRVRFCMGAQEQMQRVFSGKVEKPFASGRYVQEALAVLPAKRNMIGLVDLAGLLPMVGPMMGMPQTGPIPPGPPAAIAVSFAGEPARLDIHVPVRAIERIIQAVGGQDEEF